MEALINRIAQTLDLLIDQHIELKSLLLEKKSYKQRKLKADKDYYRTYFPNYPVGQAFSTAQLEIDTSMSKSLVNIVLLYCLKNGFIEKIRKGVYRVCRQEL